MSGQLPLGIRADQFQTDTYKYFALTGTHKTVVVHGVDWNQFNLLIHPLLLIDSFAARLVANGPALVVSG